MKKTLIIFIIIIISGYFIYNNKKNNTYINQESKPIYNSNNVDIKPQCYDYDKYFVIKKNKLDQVGEDIIVKYKKNIDEKINCEYIVNVGDFEFKGTSPDHFKLIYKKYIIIDIGTSIERQFSVYDLDTREEVYKNNIQGGVNISDNLLTFKVVTPDIPNKDNCLNYDEIKSMGGGIALYENVTFDLDTLKELVSDKKECTYVQ